jgi:hypothetical protein
MRHYLSVLVYIPYVPGVLSARDHVTGIIHAEVPSAAQSERYVRGGTEEYGGARRSTEAQRASAGRAKISEVASFWLLLAPSGSFWLLLAPPDLGKGAPASAQCGEAAAKAPARDRGPR